MQITALTCGYALPQVDFDATVHSVFCAAANLRPAADDLLLTLVAAGEADLPQGVRLGTPAGFSFEFLRCGCGVSRRGSRLVFEGSDLVVEVSQARRWRCDLPSLRIGMGNPARTRAWKSIWRSLNGRQMDFHADIVAQDILHPYEKAHSATARRLGEAVLALLDSTRRYLLDPAAVSRLVGLGGGLTPAGDDVLVGFLAGLWSTVRDMELRRRYVAALGRAVIAASRQTNDLSRTYLYHAAQGQVSSRLEALASAIGRGKKLIDLLAAAEAAMRSGHTSGMEAVTGLLVGLTAWDADLFALAAS